MWEDPIVAEVHRIREKLAAEHGFDVKKIFADLRKRQAASAGTLVPQKKRKGAAQGEQDRRSGPPDSTSIGAAPTA